MRTIEHLTQADIETEIANFVRRFSAGDITGACNIYSPYVAYMDPTCRIDGRAPLESELTVERATTPAQTQIVSTGTKVAIANDGQSALAFQNYCVYEADKLNGTGAAALFFRLVNGRPQIEADLTIVYSPAA